MDILSSNKGLGNVFRRPELNWGILSTARIGQKSVIPAIQSTKSNLVYAVASRDLTRAMEFAAPLQIPKAYGSYEELLEDENVQAVYIPLPNSEHVKWTVKALQAGKHVLVEKPFALSADEAQLMISTALETKLTLMEAFMYRYNSRFEKLLEIVHSGEIGQLRFIESSFTYNLANPDDIRLVPELGGGALYDVGCYSLNFQRLLVGREPLRVQALCHLGQSGVDLQVNAVLDFGEQVYGHFTAAFNAVPQQSMRLIGTDGSLEIENPFATHAQATVAYLKKSGNINKISFRAENDYGKMIEHFYNVAVKKDKPRFPLADAINNLVVIDALYQSAIDGGRPVKILK